jgi:ribosome recycling factor
MENFEIGQKVKWKIGNANIEGVVYEDQGEFIEVMIHKIGEQRRNGMVKVDRKLLKLN